MLEKQFSNESFKDGEMSIKTLIILITNWILFLKSKWLTVLIGFMVGGLLGLGYSTLEKPKYTAILSFALEDEKSGGGGLSGALGLASSLGIDLGTSAGGAFSGANLIELMKSRTLIERALLNPISINNNNVSLAEYYLEFSGLKEKLSKKKELANIHYLVNDNRLKFTLQKDSVLGELYKKIVGPNSEPLLSVGQKDKKISIINVEVTTQDELFSKILAESLVKEVSEFYVASKSKKARNNVAILQIQVDSIRGELNAAISGVAESSDNTFNLNPSLNIKRTPSTKRQVDVQANTAILTQLVTNLEMAKVTLLKETPLIQIIDKPILPLKKEKTGLLKGFVLLSILSGVIVIIFITIRRILQGILKD
jgi:uncharacterized protein involved in exopolysaccharide biosynthesis